MGSDWSLLFVTVLLGAAGAAGYYLCSTGIRRATALGRRLSLVLGWVSWAAIASCAAWLLFQHADAEAGRIGRNNIGIGIVYFFGWVVSTFVGPLAGYASMALWRHFHRD